MIAQALVFPILMLAGSAAILAASLWQTRLLRQAGFPALPRPFNVHEYDANQVRTKALRATPGWKRARLVLWAGASVVILGALMQMPNIFG